MRTKKDPFQQYSPYAIQMVAEQKALEAEMAEMKRKAFEGLPTEFIEFIECYAYERGHSGGQEEVDSYARGLATDFKPYLEKFLARIQEKSC